MELLEMQPPTATPDRHLWEVLGRQKNTKKQEDVLISEFIPLHMNFSLLYHQTKLFDEEEYK